MATKKEQDKIDQLYSDVSELKFDNNKVFKPTLKRIEEKLDQGVYLTVKEYDDDMDSDNGIRARLKTLEYQSEFLKPVAALSRALSSNLVKFLAGIILVAVIVLAYRSLGQIGVQL